MGTLTTKSAQQTTASKIVVGSALIGDIIRFSTSGSCTGTGTEIEDVTVITAGSVMTKANLNAGSVTACFATKEDPTAFTNIGTITVNAKSLIVEYVLTLKKADGSEMTLAEIKSETWYAEWETEIAAQFATENGLKAGSVVVESITQGSLIINFKVYGSDAELTAVEAKMKDPAVLTKPANEFAADASTLDTNTDYTGTGTASASSGGDHQAQAQDTAWYTQDHRNLDDRADRGHGRCHRDARDDAPVVNTPLLRSQLQKSVRGSDKHPRIKGRVKHPPFLLFAPEQQRRHINHEQPFIRTRC